jgi:hypothetical protein
MLEEPNKAISTLKEDTHMADLPPERDPSDEGGAGPGIPRWVKVFGIIVIVLVLLVGIVLVTGIGGHHGPGRHMPSGGAGGPIPPSSIIEDYTPPGGDLGGYASPEGGEL